MILVETVNIPVEPQITEYLHAKAAHFHVPLNGTFELTPVCNMACKMCYVRMTQAQQEAISPLRTADEWLALGREAKERGLLYLLLTGGEPFVRPDLREILTGLHRLGLIVSINTNGTRIDESVVGWLKETPPARMNITLYGASDETYARLCGNPQGFTQVTRAIRLLQEAGITIKLNCSLTPHNAHDLDAIMAYAKENGLLVQATSYMFPPLRRDASLVGQNDRFSPEEAAYWAARIESLMNGEERFVERMKENSILSLPAENGEDCPVLDEQGEGIRCRAGKCSFWVTWDGHLLPCGMLPHQSELNVFEVGFDKAWQQAISVASAIRLPAACKSCPLQSTCKSCAAMVLTESGRYDMVPDYRCRMTKAYPAACQQVVDEIISKRGL